MHCRQIRAREVNLEAANELGSCKEANPQRALPPAKWGPGRRERGVRATFSPASRIGKNRLLALHRQHLRQLPRPHFHPSTPLNHHLLSQRPSASSSSPYASTFAGLIGCLQLLLRCLAALCHSFNSHQITLIFLVERYLRTRREHPIISSQAPIANHRGPRNNWPRPLQLETQQQTTRASSVLVSFRCVCCSVNVNPTAPS